MKALVLVSLASLISLQSIAQIRGDRWEVPPPHARPGVIYYSDDPVIYVGGAVGVVSIVDGPDALVQALITTGLVITLIELENGNFMQKVTNDIHFYDTTGTILGGSTLDHLIQVGTKNGISQEDAIENLREATAE